MAKRNSSFCEEHVRLCSMFQILSIIIVMMKSDDEMIILMMKCKICNKLYFLY